MKATRKILIADDNRDAAETLSMLLETEGHEVRIAHDGQAAVDAAGVFRPDVLLLDVGMPKLDGYEVAKRIRAESWGAAVTIIAITGWGLPEDRERAKHAGFTLHLTKPVDFDRLLAAI